jgi:hypothetical protein
MNDTYEDRLLYIKIFNAYKAKKRDIGLEQEIIAKDDPDAACLYAIHVVKGAWEAAEHIITKASAYDYRNGYLTRFPSSDGNLIISYNGKRGANQTTNVSDPIHSSYSYKDQWGRSATRLIVKSTTQIANAYTRLTKKRNIGFEKNTRVDSKWMAKRVMYYCSFIYENTGEVVDFENGLVAVQIIEAIKNNEFAKKPISYEEKERIVKELEQRMTLYSFTTTQDDSLKSGRRKNRGRRSNTPLSAIKNYFETRVEAMNELYKILAEHDENMTIGELKKVLRNEKAA